MLRPQDDIYVTLPSNDPGVPGNKPSNFKTILPTPLKHNGAWEVALLETHYPPQIANFNVATMVVICTEDSPKVQGDQPQPYWMQPQSLQSARAQSHRDEVDGSWPSGEEDEELDPGVTRYRAHDGPVPTAPQPQPPPQGQTSTEGDKKPEQPKGEEKKPEPAKEADKKPDVAKEGDAANKEDAGKKPTEDASTKTPEDPAAKKKKTDEEEAARKKAEAVAAKKAEEKRQEELSNHLTKPLFMLAQAGLKFMKDRPNLGKVGQVIHIKPLYYPTLDDLLEEVCNQIMSMWEIECVSFTHNPLTRRISLEWRHGTLNFLSFDKYFFDHLGLGTAHEEIFSKSLYFTPSKIWGHRRATLDTVQKLYDYSDVIEDQIVGKLKEILMAVFPFKGSNGEHQSWQFNPFQYSDIPSSNIPSITIGIFTPTAEDVRFMSVDNLCRLHFRGKMREKEEHHR